MLSKLRIFTNLYKLLWLEDRVNYLENGKIEDLRRQLDQLKSSLEVPQELIYEFTRWKTTNHVSANPLVSVCVATYNRQQLLIERCIPSILSQTYKNLELIVVGDGCTDNTSKLIKEIKDSRLKFTNLQSRGSYPEDPNKRWLVAGTQALNQALSLASGEFITHLDDDDEYMPERIEKLLDFATENGCDVVWHPYWHEVRENQWVLNESLHFDVNQVTTSSVFYRSWFKHIKWNIEAHQLLEPGDWNRFRRIKFIDPMSKRYPEPLLKHYKENNQVP